MFELVKNNFLDGGTCEYRNENGDIVKMTRIESGFKGSIELKDKIVSVSDIEAKGMLKGVELKFSPITDSTILYMNGDKFRKTIADYGKILQRWNELCINISRFAAGKSICFLQPGEEFNEKSVEKSIKERFSKISKYEEVCTSPGYEGICKYFL